MREMLQQFVNEVFSSLGKVLAVVVATQAIFLLRWVSKKTGVQLSTAEEQAVEGSTQRFVMAVEEQGAKAAMSSLEKHAAVAKMLGEKFPQLTAAEIDTQIHAAVAGLGIGAAAKANAPAQPEPPAASSSPPAPPPKSSQAGSVHFTLLLFLALLAGLIGFGLACSGCACDGRTKKIDSATCARQVVTAVDTLNGAAARIARRAVRSCGDAGKALQQTAEGLKASGKLEAAAAAITASDAKYSQCTVMGETTTRVIVGVEDGAQLAADGIDVGEKAAKTDYGNLVQPLLQAARDMVKTLTDHAIQLPATVTAFLGGV